MAHSKRTGYGWSEAIEFSVLLVGLMVLIALLDWLMPVDLRVLGILPRTGRGLLGVFLGPLLHGSYGHLLANAWPLLVLLVLLFAERKYYPERTLACIWVGSGLGTWLIGRGGYVHIGASSLIYGLVVYLVASGWWMRSWRSVLVALTVLLLYGGIVYGLMPRDGLISWEGHLAGALAGLLAARFNHS